MIRSLSASIQNPVPPFTTRALFATSVLFLAATAASPVHAQATTYTSAPPQIVVSANGSVIATPDRASIQLGVQTDARTAAMASTENNRKQTAVLTAIKALGIPASAITTSGFSVYPVQSNTTRSTIDSYRVDNVVTINVSKIEQIGAVIDAALAAGANRVASLNFELSDPSKAREEAITKAVTQARRDAEVSATAAGGQIRGLLELTVNSFEQQRPMPMYAMAKSARADDSTPVSEGTITVQVSVTVRWAYVGGGVAR